MYEYTKSNLSFVQCIKCLSLLEGYNYNKNAWSYVHRHLLP